MQEQPSLVNVHTNEYNQEFDYYPFAVKLDRYVLEVATLLMTYLKKYEFQIWLQKKWFCFESF